MRISQPQLATILWFLACFANLIWTAQPTKDAAAALPLKLSRRICTSMSCTCAINTSVREGGHFLIMGSNMYICRMEIIRLRRSLHLRRRLLISDHTQENGGSKFTTRMRLKEYKNKTRGIVETPSLGSGSYYSYTCVTAMIRCLRSLRIHKV